MKTKQCVCKKWKEEMGWSTPRKDGEWTIGYCPDPIKFCPWCGTKLVMIDDEKK